MRKLTTVKQVLIRMKYKVNTKQTGVGSYFFLCCIPQDLEAEGIISEELVTKTRKYIESQKPSHILNEEFFNHECCKKDSTIRGGWWKSYKKEKGKEIIKQKKLFLKHIINKLS